jgi:hypothetical protein
MAHFTSIVTHTINNIVTIWEQTDNQTSKFIAHNPYMPAWKSQTYGSNFQKNYSNPASNPNNNNANNNGVSGSNLPALESSLIFFINSENEQNKMLMKITKKQDTLIATLSNQAVSMKSGMQDFQERTKTVEAQLAK